MYTDTFQNEERTRYYGKRIGDIVMLKDLLGDDREQATVIEFTMDNNRIIVRNEKGEEFPVVAEWCTILTKVEDIINTNK